MVKGGILYNYTTQYHGFQYIIESAYIFTFSNRMMLKVGLGFFLVFLKILFNVFLLQIARALFIVFGEVVHILCQV